MKTAQLLTLAEVEGGCPARLTTSFPRSLDVLGLGLARSNHARPVFDGEGNDHVGEPFGELLNELEVLIGPMLAGWWHARDVGGSSLDLYCPDGVRRNVAAAVRDDGRDLLSKHRSFNSEEGLDVGVDLVICKVGKSARSV